VNSIWNRLYDSAKDRRYGFIFLITLLMFFGLLPLGAVLFETSLRDYVIPALPWLAAAGLVRASGMIRRALARRRDRLPFPPLSCDELRAARSKLLKERDRKSV
jgi:hypothetical protein